MENKQTAVEWIQQELFQRYNFIDDEFIFYQAKEIEKKQIKDAWINGDENYAQSYAAYKGIVPLENWRINEIQKMINSVRGYENVEIAFELFQNIEYKNPSYTCRIKLVDGEKILLRYEWVIKSVSDENVHSVALNDATRILMRDIWLTAIDSFKNLTYGN